MVDKLLLRTLKDFRNQAFLEFKRYLNQKNLDGVEPIPVSDLEDADRGETVSQMTRSYGAEMAVKVAVKILKKMRNKDAGERLTEKYADRVGELLLETLQDLDKGDLLDFMLRLKLKNVAFFQQIPKSKFGDISRKLTVTQMTRLYSEELAVEVAVEILKQMSKMYAAKELTEKYADRVGELLLETLESLGTEYFGKFKCGLYIRTYKHITWRKLKDASRGQTVKQMTRILGEKMAVKVTVEVLKKMKNMKAAAELRKKYAEMNGAVPSSSSSSSSSASSSPAASPPAASPPAASPPAAASMSAQNGSVIVAPRVAGSLHTLNLTINK
ncbi:uncharacterized protein [Pseudochaenichthys georgianus]|uniref:uncharacterized protein n=1 Tax=Pseudochaenichthys georgianus TaxID=52239 RepID=UPI00146F3997|nr:uncharacterized protein LOC117449874 [Pseudochaenichthys georgianus]XP_033943678.1 uncharacterized protein LOC117449874 [Pseudochaenichthys georgianus]